MTLKTKFWFHCKNWNLTTKNRLKLREIRNRSMLKRKYQDYYNILEENPEDVTEEIKRCKAEKQSLYDDSDIILPHKQLGLVVETIEGELVCSSNLSVSQHLQDYQILVKNKFIGLNHVDWKSKKYKFNIYSLPWINGRESSGTVVKRGSEVDKSKFPVGAEVFLASTSYRDQKTSTFQEYTVFDSRLVWKLPEVKLPNGLLSRRFDLDFASGIGVALVTAGTALSSFINFKVDDREINKRLGNITIWGGTSSVGIFAIQLAKASKKFDKIIVVANKKYQEYLTELGANYIIDRFQSEEKICEEIFKKCPEGITYGIDLISKATATTLSKILENENTKVKKLVCVVGAPEISTTSLVSSKSKLIIENVSIKHFHEDIEFGRNFVEYTSKLFESGLLRPIKSLKIFKGLGHFGEAIKNGLMELEERGPSAEKFVVSI